MKMNFIATSEGDRICCESYELSRSGDGTTFYITCKNVYSPCSNPEVRRHEVVIQNNEFVITSKPIEFLTMISESMTVVLTKSFEAIKLKVETTDISDALSAARVASTMSRRGYGKPRCEAIWDTGYLIITAADAELLSKESWRQACAERDASILRHEKDLEKKKKSFWDRVRSALKMKIL